MNKTEHFQLNQWELSDRIMMEDFNADNAKIEAALGAVPKLAFGTYTGTGKYGKANPNTLTFDFAPRLVVVTKKALTDQVFSRIIMINGQTRSCCTSSGGASQAVDLTWTETGVSWYNTADAQYQLNSNIEYVYFAIG